MQLLICASNDCVYRCADTRTLCCQSVLGNELGSSLPVQTKTATACICMTCLLTQIKACLCGKCYYTLMALNLLLDNGTEAHSTLGNNSPGQRAPASCSCQAHANQTRTSSPSGAELPLKLRRQADSRYAHKEGEAQRHHHRNAMLLQKLNQPVKPQNLTQAVLQPGRHPAAVLQPPGPWLAS